MLLNAAEVQPLLREDVPEVARLWQKVFRKSDQPASPALQKHFQEIFFEGPWADPELPSLVCRAGNDEIIGFLGRFPRTMTFKGRTIRSAIATQLMIDTTRHRGFGAIQLMRKFLSGPQDLSFTDGADESARKIWEHAGGATAKLYCLEWTRMIRPMQFASNWMRHSRRLALAGKILRPFARPLDAMMMSSGPLRPREIGEHIREDATSEVLLECLRDLESRYSLCGRFNADSLEWLLDQAGQAKRYGELKRRTVRKKDGRVVGWYVYYAKPGVRAQVLHLHAAPKSFSIVMNALVLDAHADGAIAIEGGMQPEFLADFSNNRCWLKAPGLGVLVHSRDPDLLQTIHRGEAMLSRLDGEWWMKFGIDRHLNW